MHIEFIENELAKSTWFASDELTGAGILVLSPPLMCRYHDELPGADFSHQGKRRGNGCFSNESLLEKNGRTTRL